MILRRITAVFVFILGLTFIAPGYNFAASKCKELKKSSCIKKSRCSWVKTHIRKGKEIQGHCRKKGKKSKISKIYPTKKKIRLKRKRRLKNR